MTATDLPVAHLARTTEPRVQASTTPVVSGFHPDPSVCRVGDTYYLVNSSFEFAPGVPIRRSTDLVDWELIGNVLSGPEHFVAGSAGPNGGVFAPTVRHHDGRFWMITTNVSGGRPGQLVTSAVDPSGPWAPARTILGLAGIDPDLAWDDDGRCFVTYCSSDPALPGIAQATVDLDTAALTSEPRVIWSGTGMQHPEGPHLYRRGAWWYLLIAEGGTERGHAVSVARSASPSGPFESNPRNPILSHRSTQHPVQNTGHADLVELVDGSWAMVYLGVRPRGVTPSFHVNGRETFLAGIDWVDGWPVVVEDRYAFVEQDSSFVDRFVGEALDPRWVSPGARVDDLAEQQRGGGVLLRPAEAHGRAGMLLTRTRDESWSCDAVVEHGSLALLVRSDDRHWVELRLDRQSVAVVARVGSIETSVGSAETVAFGPVTLRARSIPSLTGGPDDLEFGVVEHGVFRSLARLDGRYLSTEVAGGFTGRMIGVRALAEQALLGEFAYRADASPSS